MTRNEHQQTARIYQFPIKPRRTEDTARRAWPSLDQQRGPVPATDFGSGWYHDAAIRTDPAHPHAG